MPRRGLLSYHEALGLDRNGQPKKDKKAKRRTLTDLYNSEDQTPNPPKKKIRRDGNIEYMVRYHTWMRRFRNNQIADILNADVKIKHSQRAQLYEQMMSEVQPLMIQYSPCVPSGEILDLICTYARTQGVVEIGARNGYWGHLLSNRGIFYAGFETNTQEYSSSFCELRAASPEDVLKDFTRCALLLVAPDWNRPKNAVETKGKKRKRKQAQESLSLRALRAFRGEVVIHVGELFGETTSTTNVWGQTTDGDFQQELFKRYYKVIQRPILQWPSRIDCITIFRKTTQVQIGDQRFGLRRQSENQTFRASNVRNTATPAKKKKKKT